MKAQPISESTPPAVRQERSIDQLWDRFRRFYVSLGIMLLNSILIFVLLESGLRFASWIKRTIFPVPPPSYERYLALYPGLVESQVKELRESMKDEAEYAPWVQFRTPNRTSKFLNVHDGIRATVPRGNGNDVWFFGGSTLYGYNVADRDTIPSQFASMSGKNVVNYGQPYYLSSQEVDLFFHLLMKGNRRSETAIFLDGLNDVLSLGREEPYWTSELKRLFRDHSKPDWSGAWNGIESLSMVRLMRRLGFERPQLVDVDESPPKILDDEVAAAIIENYLKSADMARKLGRAYGVNCYFFIQPVPFYHYPNRNKDPFSVQIIQNDDPGFKRVYDRLKESNDIIFLGNMLETETGLPFVDGFHYSPAFNRRIAEAMIALSSTSSRVANE
jgi:hypothetical protein